MLLARALWVSFGVSTLAWASADRSREALDRVEETLTMELENGGLDIKALAPIMVVSVMPANEASSKWYPNAALSVLMRVFGGGSVRVCEACMSTRVYSIQGRLEHNSTGLDVVELKALDEQIRGTSDAAQTAVWLDETASGVSVRVVDLRNSRILVARNFDAGLKETARTLKLFNYSKEIERRARGDSLMHSFLDVRFINSGGISIDIVEQWGAQNRHLSGLSLSFLDPFLGLGGSYFYVMPEALKLTFGVRVMVSIPTAIGSALVGSLGNFNGLEPLLSATFVARLPIAQSNWAVLASGSTNGTIGLGVSLMNVSFFPFLP